MTIFLNPPTIQKDRGHAVRPVPVSRMAIPQKSAFSIDGNGVFAAATIFAGSSSNLRRISRGSIPPCSGNQPSLPIRGTNRTSAMPSVLYFASQSPRDTDKFLVALVLANGDYQPAANSKLPLLGIGHHWPGRRNNNRVIGRIFRPALRTIAMANKDIVIMQIGKEAGGLFGELGNAFNRIDLSGDARKNGSRVTGARADLKRRVLRPSD